jgi:putative tryptophan/tyrosine transport system substrate-binding protein
MRRRDFITLLGGAAATWPLAARAQRSIPTVGYLYLGGSRETADHYVAAFLQGLSDVGLLEGRNVAVEYRFAEDPGQMPKLAADLIRRRVSVIVTPNSIAAAHAAKAATATIPIVFGTSGDPVEDGLVSSFNRPGGNVTGFVNMTVDTEAKRLGILRELLPGAMRIAVLVNPNRTYTEITVKEVAAAAASIGCEVDVVRAATIGAVEAAFATFAQARPDALLVTPSPTYESRRVQMVTLATINRLPAMYSYRGFTDVGGLISYGPRVAEQYHQVGLYAGRILKGERPGDLPIVRQTKFEFVINLQTARAFGIAVAPTLLALADEIIE